MLRLRRKGTQFRLAVLEVLQAVAARRVSGTKGLLRKKCNGVWRMMPGIIVGDQIVA